MPYFTNEKYNILFIHIPKTAGTSFERYLSKKCNIELNEKSLYSLSEKYFFTNNISYQHQTLSTILKNKTLFQINTKNLKIYTIVRNPYHKIISGLFYSKLINSNTPKNVIFDIIKNKYCNQLRDNHSIPQYKFLMNNGKIDDRVNIIKFENINEDMKKFGFTDFSFHENKNSSNISQHLYIDYLNNDSIKFINQFYHWDFIYFNYPKIKV